MQFDDQGGRYSCGNTASGIRTRGTRNREADRPKVGRRRSRTSDDARKNTHTNGNKGMTAFVNRICASHANERSTAHTAHCQTVMLTGTPQKSVPKRDENRSRSDEKTRKFRRRALRGASMRSWGVRDGARERPGRRRRRPGTDLGTPGEGQERSSGAQKRPQTG